MKLQDFIAFYNAKNPATVAGVNQLFNDLQVNKEIEIETNNIGKVLEVVLLGATCPQGVDFVGIDGRPYDLKFVTSRNKANGDDLIPCNLLAIVVNKYDYNIFIIEKDNIIKTLYNNKSYISKKDILFTEKIEISINDLLALISR